MTKKPDRTVYQRPADKKWVDRRNDADRGFVHDTQKDAIQSAKEKITNQGGGELTVKGRDGKILARTRSAAVTIPILRKTKNIDAFHAARPQA
ncbi:DUF2188 domain-containing protein [Mesorhizobium opportunistum]|uniref:DUF2188 domain-containing protein n=1 Tax=Mesorhizobium opportunistum TaxID=593909 RepID=UPI003334BA66